MPTHAQVVQTLSHLEHALERISDGCIAFDREMTFVFINAAGAARMGSRAEALIGRNYWRLFPQAAESRVGIAYREALDTQQPVFIEDYDTTAQGWFAYRIYPSHDGISVFIHSLPDYQATETARRQTYLRMQTVLDGLPDGILIADAETRRFVFCNQAMRQMLGYSPDEIATLSLADLHPAEAMPRVLTEFGRGTQQQHAYAPDLPVRRKDGSTFPADIHTVQIDLDGRPCVCGVFSDITLRKQDQQRIVEAKNRAEASELLLLEAQKVAHIGHWELHLDTGRLTWSDEVYTMFGYTPQTFAPSFEAFMACVHPDDRDRVSQTYQAHLTHRTEYDLVHRIVLPGGEVKYVHERCETTCDEAGRPLRSLGVVADVTALKQAEMALQEKLRELETAQEDIRQTHRVMTLTLDRAVDAVIRVNSTREIVYFNPAAEQMFGYTQAEVLHQQLSMLLPPEERAQHDAYIDENLRAGVERVIGHGRDFELTHRDGRTFWGHVSLSKIVHAGEMQYTAFIKDITDRKVAEDLLRTNEERLDQIAAHSRTIAWEVDAGGLYTYISHVAADVLGYTPDEIIGRLHFYDLHPEEAREAFKAAALDVFRRREAFKDYENMALTKQGQQVWLSTSGVPMLGADGTLLGYRGSDTDITERKRAEHESHLLRQAIESSTVGIVLADAALPDLPVVYVNRAFEATTGYTAAETLGRNCRFLQGGDREQEGVSVLREAIAAGRSASATLRNYRKDGSQFWNHLTISPLYAPDGRLTHFVGIQKDVTDLKHTEEALAIQASELSARNAQFDTLLDTLPDLVWLKDTSGRYLRCNRRFGHFIGRPAEQIVGGTDYDFFDHELATFFRKHDLHAIDAGEARINEEWVTFGDGHQELLETTKTPMIDRQGNLIGVLGIGHDITERHHAEAALRESESKYRTLIQSLPVGIAVIDENEHISLTNSKLGEQTGYTHDEVPTVEDFMKRVYPDKVRFDHYKSLKYSIFRAISQQQPIAPMEAQIRHKDGSEREMEIGFIKTGAYHIATFVDITQRKQAESTLRAERDLFSEGPVLTIVWEPRPGWPVAYISQNATQVLGYTPAEITDTDFQYASLIHPDDQAHIAAEVAYNMAHRIDSFEQSYRLRLKSGEYRWFYDFTRFQRDAAGTLSAIRGYIFDQTQLKDLEQDLEAERQRLAYIITGTHAGTWEWNIQTGETVYNERWAEIAGYTLAELAPLSIETWERLAHPDDLIRSQVLLQQHFSGELDYYECESRLRHKDGSWVWILDRGKVSVWDTDGRPLLMSGTHQDITLSKQAEAALRESEERFRNIFEENASVMFLVDPADGRFVDVNPACEAFYGWSRAGFRSMHLQDIVESPYETGQHIAGLLRSHRADCRHRLADGSTRDMEVFNSNISIEGRRLVHVIAQDVTAQNAYQAALQAQNKLLREIAWTQSHVVRAPLARLMGLIDIFGDTSPTHLPQDEVARMMMDSARELDQIIRSIAEQAFIVEAMTPSKDLRSNGRAAQVPVTTTELLLVDDDQIVQRMHKFAAVKNGLHPAPQVFMSGRPALEFILAHNTPGTLHIVLLDINMPEMNGWDFLEALRQVPLRCLVMVFMVSSSVDIADQARARQYPQVIDYITKPLTQQSILDLKHHPRLQPYLGGEQV